MRLAGLLLLTGYSLLAQEVTGGISGQVTDALGAAIASAEVAATHTATGASRRVRSDAGGHYSFQALPIGEYELTASQAGFKRARRTEVELHISDKLLIDLVLEVGELAQEVTVSASAAQVEVETSAQGGLISGEQVRELQLNGRSFMTLLELLPGVASDMPDRADPNTNPLLYVNGARNSAANFNIDGGNNSDVIVGSGSLNTFTSVETIAEVKVLTSSFTAEYGRGGFAQVNVVTRGGTKRYRGSLYHFLRNDALDARDYFSHQVLPLKLNNFGYTLGGPVSFAGYNRSRTKTFFFWTQEFNILSTRGEAVNTQVPSANERAGIFTTTIVDPLNGNAPIPGNRLPASLMDDNAVKLLNLYPLPNFRGPGAINFTSAAASRQNWREELVRIDHNLSEGWKLYGRFAQDSADITNPYGGSSVTAIGTRFPGISRTSATRPGKNLTVNMTNFFSQSALNEFSFTYSGREITQTPIADEANRTRLGIDIKEIFAENDGNVIPTINLGSGFAALSVSRVWLKQLFNLEFSNNFTKTMGRNVLKMGGIYSYGGNRENPTAPLTNGSFSFTTAFTRNPIANMLLGLPFTYTEAERFVVSRARFGLAEAFVQDDMRATERLTLNFGLRWSNYLNPYDTENVLSNFLPSSFDPGKAQRIDPVSGRPVPGSGDPLNGMILAGKNSPYGKRVTDNLTNLLGPRFGFAYNLRGNGKTAIRGGYGLYYTRPLIGTFINSAFDNPPFARTVVINNPQWRNPSEGVEAAANVVAVTALGNPMKTPAIHQFSFNVQQELMKQTILSVSYVASRGRHLMRPFNINSPQAGAAAARGVHVNAVRPYPGYAAITERQTTAWSKYDSLQVSANRRMATKMSLGLAYTWSKSIDTASSDRGGGDVPPNAYNPDSERALSDHDRQHILTINTIYWLPRFTRNHFAGVFLNGWQTSGILRFWTGRPFDVVMSTDVAGIGAVQNQRPNVVADARGPRTVEEWFNREAFARPASGTFGDMGRNSLRYPGVNKWDLALFKNFGLGERGRTLQFRAEMFNAFNHPSFTTVGISLTTTAAAVNPAANSFAVVTGTRDARVVQFAMKLSF
ncbi:MAG: carboxypeptidase regulatory-like domain-containing protein [Bryobacterales bacterium]|nr:carboxypeptidase regulatory-like domain-containing protein [Bryobacterales bacterium]